MDGSQFDPYYGVIMAINPAQSQSPITLSNCARADGPFGECFVASTETGYARTSDDQNRILVKRQFSAIAVITPRSRTASDFMFANTNAAGVFNWGFYWASTGFQAYISNTTPTAVATAGVSFSNDSPIVFGISYDGATIRAYINGKQVATASQTGDVRITDGYLSFANYNGGTTIKCDYHFGAAANVLWSPQDFMDLAVNPWRIYANYRHRFMSAAAAAFQPAWAIQSNTILHSGGIQA